MTKEVKWTGVITVKKLLAVALLTCTAAYGQTTMKHKPAVAAQTGWVKHETKDEITDKITTSVYVSSLPPDKAMLLIACRPEGAYLTIHPNFQVAYDDVYHNITIPIRTDDVASETSGTVAGDLDNMVMLGNGRQTAILESTKIIKIKLFEFGRGPHVMTFKLQGPPPDCEPTAKVMKPTNPDRKEYVTATPETTEAK
jgi:hypothetical protein